MGASRQPQHPQPEGGIQERNPQLALALGDQRYVCMGDAAECNVRMLFAPFKASVSTNATVCQYRASWCYQVTWVASFVVLSLSECPPTSPTPHLVRIGSAVCFPCPTNISAQRLICDSLIYVASAVWCNCLQSLTTHGLRYSCPLRITALAAGCPQDCPSHASVA